MNDKDKVITFPNKDDSGKDVPVNLPDIGECILSDDFGDPETLLNSRDWLEKCITNGGARVTGGGVGGGQADLSFVLDGAEFSVYLKPKITQEGA